MNMSESFSIPLVALTIERALAHERRRLASHLARGVARDDEDDHLCAVESGGYRVGGAHVPGERDARQVSGVLAVRVEGVAQLSTPCPEDDFTLLFRQELRQRRAPRAGAEHGDLHGREL